MGVCRLSSTCLASPSFGCELFLPSISFSHLLLAHVRSVFILMLDGWFLFPSFALYFSVNFSCSLCTLVSQFQLCLDYFIVMLGIMTILSFSFKANFTLGKFFTANKCSVRSRVSFMTCTRSYANPERVSLSLCVCVRVYVGVLLPLQFCQCQTRIDGWMDGWLTLSTGNAKLLQHILY